MKLVLLLLMGVIELHSLTTPSSVTNRRTFISKFTASSILVSNILPASAAAPPEVLSTSSGLKYSFLIQGKGSPPESGDVVAIDYTGYLLDGRIFDKTHAEGANNNLTFRVGDRAVIKGLEEIVTKMTVGSKVQVIIPPGLAYGTKGVCLPDNGDCLIAPGSTLVYDVFLKRAAIPPP